MVLYFLCDVNRASISIILKVVYAFSLKVEYCRESSKWKEVLYCK